MDPNQPQPSTSVGPQNMQAPVFPGAPGQQPVQQPPFAAPPDAATTANAYMASSPLQNLGGPQPFPSVQAPANAAPAPMAQTFSSPLQPSAMPAQPPLGMPVANAGGQGIPGSRADLNDDNDVSVDDAVWIARAKRAILESKGDPHRQTQLIQHLRAEYLKQRYGRMVHTDEA